MAVRDGPRVGVIDTGTSQYQPELQQDFATGQSAERTAVYEATRPNGRTGVPTWHDSCSHGTKTAGLIAAPRNGANVVGVAYGADLYAVRAVDDPITVTGEWLEVRRAITESALRGVKVVNMSFGSSFENSDVANTIRYYYDDQRYRTLFFGAAGTRTQFLGAVFPSSMPEVEAVTGLDPDTPFPYTDCSDCNRSSKVAFSAFTRGQTTGPNEGQVDGYGGSSAATALTSGIAALVWSRYPTWTREQVVERMRAAAPFPVRERGIGHGPVNAACAVGGICSVGISGSGLAWHGEPFTLSATVRSLDPAVLGRLTYMWSLGGPGASTTHTVTDCPGTTVPFHVFVTDPVTRASEVVRGSYRVAYSDEPVPGCEPPPDAPV